MIPRYMSLTLLRYNAFGFSLLNLVIAAAYAAAGAFGPWLGGQFEGNVTLLWPPTGIALAAAYLFGMRKRCVAR